MSEPPPITTIITIIKMHIAVKQHLICSSCGFPLNALQLMMTIANYPATIPQIAVDAPIALLSNSAVAAKMLPPIPATK